MKFDPTPTGNEMDRGLKNIMITWDMMNTESFLCIKLHRSLLAYLVILLNRGMDFQLGSTHYHSDKSKVIDAFDVIIIATMARS